MPHLKQGLLTIMKKVTDVAKNIGAEFIKGIIIAILVILAVVAYFVGDLIASDTRKATNHFPNNTSITCPPELGLMQGSTCTIGVCEITKEEANCLLRVRRIVGVSL